jgi:hypothetical protein
MACTIKMLPRDQWVAAADTAIRLNPTNRPLIGRLPLAEPNLTVRPEHLAILTSKMWPNNGVELTVSFVSRIRADFAQKIIEHMNAWGQYCKTKFKMLTSGSGQVRIAFQNDGYWSYLGTDILHIPSNQHTMNLQGFDSQMPDSEYHRVVRHETGHTLGFPHEHMRRELVDRLDPQKTISYFQQFQGWPPQMTQEQVLTPIDEASIRGTPNADQDSIMCYQLPGSITKDGQEIRGGTDIDPLDQQFASKCYPLDNAPPPPPPNNGFKKTVTIESADPNTKVTLV